MKKQIVACFETNNKSLSKLVLKSESDQRAIENFIAGNIPAFSTLHVFYSENEAIRAYREINKIIISY